MKNVDGMSITEAGIVRLENWACWAINGEAAIILRHTYPRQVAACALYRSTEIHDSIDDYGDSIIVDPEDAFRVDVALGLLPAHLKTAVTNKYIGRPQILNTPRSVLDGWVEQAARALMTRWP